MVVVDGIALEIHSPGVPVAVLRYTLCRPVGPNTELGVAKPFRTAVVLRDSHVGWNGPEVIRRCVTVVADARALRWNSGSVKPAPTASADVFRKLRLENGILMDDHK